jgi:hypothetical protein
MAAAVHRTRLWIRKSGKLAYKRVKSILSSFKISWPKGENLMGENFAQAWKTAFAGAYFEPPKLCIILVP